MDTLSNMTKEQTILTREQRAEILARCLNNRRLAERCYYSANLLQLGPDDVLNHLGVKMYEGLFYFRFIDRYHNTKEPMELAYQLALATGHNELSSLIRAKLKRANLNWNGPLEELRSTDMTTLNVTEMTDLMATTAVAVAGGQDRAALLLRASVYDWERHRDHRGLTEPQHELMTGLGVKRRSQVAKLLEDFYQRVRRAIETPRQLLTKEEGVWRARANNIR